MLKFFQKIFFIILAFTALPLRALSYNFLENSGIDKTATESGHKDSLFSSPSSIDTGISFIINAILSFVGVILLVLIIYGGVLWMTASGNEEQVKKAKNIIVNSLIGLAIVMSAYAISWFLINRFSRF